MATSNLHVTFDISLPHQRVAFPKEQKFHRVMKFGEHGLQGIVKEKALTFVSYDQWTDSHEAYLIRALHSPPVLALRWAAADLDEVNTAQQAAEYMRMNYSELIDKE